MYAGDESYDDDVTSGPIPPSGVEACPICRIVRWGITPKQEATAARLAGDAAPLCEGHDYMRSLLRYEADR